MSREKVLVGNLIKAGEKSEPRPRPKALILDFDGTMADSLPILYQMYETFLKERGRQGSPAEFHQLAGRSMLEAFQFMRETHSLDEAPEELWLAYQQSLLHHYANEVPLFEGTVPFLELISSMGMRLAICSSATRELVMGPLTRYGIEHLFEVICTPEGLTSSKPDPAIYLKTLDSLNLSPQEALAVEDTPIGIRASLAAGIPTVAMMREGTMVDVPHGIDAAVSCWQELSTMVLK